MVSMNLQNKIVCLTGATGGIGSALATALHAAGAHLILLGRDADKLALQGQALRQQADGQVTTYTCDLTDPTDRARIIKKLLTDLPHLDILINNAGIGYYDNLPEIESQEWYASYELNVHTPLFLTQGLLPLLQKSPESRVVNIGSLAGYLPKAGRATYNSTKFALRGLTLCLAEEYQGRNPQFTHIALDSVMTPFGPWTLAQKAAKAENGKVYLTPEWTAQTLVNILETPDIETEYCLSTAKYPIGTWLHPE